MNIQAFEPFTINLSLKKPISTETNDKFCEIKKPKSTGYRQA